MKNIDPSFFNSKKRKSRTGNYWSSRSRGKMYNFVAIDFETANSKRVSACSLGYAKVSNCQIVETKGYLIKPVGRHAFIQSRIHGIKYEHTKDKQDFGQLFPEIQDIFNSPLVGHSVFDQQVLNALSYHFNLGLRFDYIDTFSMAQKKLPYLYHWNLIALSKYFGIPAFKHHDSEEDAVACAKIFLKLQ